MFTANQLRAARALIGWDQRRLAKEAGLSLQTVRRMEWNDGPVGGNARSVFAVEAALTRAGIEFLNGDAPGVRVRANE